MGKATIVGGGSGGLYTIKPVHNRERLDAEITRLESSIADLEAEQLNLRVALLDAEDAVRQALETLDAQIVAYNATGDQTALMTATENLARAAIFRNQAESTRISLRGAPTIQKTLAVKSERSRFQVKATHESLCVQAMATALLMAPRVTVNCSIDPA